MLWVLCCYFSFLCFLCFLFLSFSLLSASLLYLFSVLSAVNGDMLSGQAWWGGMVRPGGRGAGRHVKSSLAEGSGLVSTEGAGVGDNARWEHGSINTRRRRCLLCLLCGFVFFDVLFSSSFFPFAPAILDRIFSDQWFVFWQCLVCCYWLTRLFSVLWLVGVWLAVWTWHPNQRTLVYFTRAVVRPRVVDGTAVCVGVLTMASWREPKPVYPAHNKLVFISLSFYSNTTVNSQSHV